MVGIVFFAHLKPNHKFRTYDLVFLYFSDKVSDEEFFLLVQGMGGVQKDEKECKSYGVLSDSYSLLKNILFPCSIFIFLHL